MRAMAVITNYSIMVPAIILFLKAIGAAVPSNKAIDAILCNVAMHKHPKVRAWLASHAGTSTPP